MFRLSTIRRKLLLGAGSLLVLSGLSLMVAQTSLVRRFVLVQAQVRLGNAIGLVIQARDLDYNLFLSRFELKDIAVRGRGLQGMPPPLTADRVVLALPLWRLVRGKFETAQIQVDGVSVRLVTDQRGRSNLPSIAGAGGRKSGSAAIPAIMLNAGNILVQDEQSGILVRLPIRQLSGSRDTAGRYGITGEIANGLAEWRESRVPVDRMSVRAALVNGGVTLESLHVVAAGSQLDVTGSLSGSPARLAATADLNLDLRGWGDFRGSLRTHLALSGLLPSIQVAASIRGDELVARGSVIRRPTVEAVFDSATGKLELCDVSGGIFSGKVNATGVLWTGAKRRKSALLARLTDLDAKQVARLLGTSEVPLDRASVELAATWPGMDWRLASAAGKIQTPSARVAFQTVAGPEAIRTSLHSTLKDDVSLDADIGYALASHAITGTVKGKAASLARVSTMTGMHPAVDGAADLRATLGGTTSAPSASVQLEVNDLAVGGWTGATVWLKANYAGARIQIDNAAVDWAGQHVEAKGEIGGTSWDAPVVLDGTIAGQSLAQVFQRLKSTAAVETAVQGEFHLSGTIGNPVADTRIQTGELTAFGEKFANATMHAAWEDGKLALKQLVLQQAEKSGSSGRIEASGSLDLDGGSYELKASGHDLRSSTTIGGLFQFEANGQGSFNDPAFSARIDGSHVTADEKEIGELHATIDGADGKAIGLVTLPAFNTRAEGTVEMAGAWPFNIRLNAKQANLPLTPASSLDADVHASGTLYPISLDKASALIANLKVDTPGTETVSDGPIELGYSEGRVRVGKLSLNSGKSKLRVSGELPVEERNAPGAILVEGSVDLAKFSDAIGGTAELNAKLAGSIRNLIPSGTMTIHEGSFAPENSPLPVGGVNGTVQIEDGVARLQQFSGTLGAGKLRIEGSVPLHLVSGALPIAAPAAKEPARIQAQLADVQITGGTAEQKVVGRVGARVEAEATALSVEAVRASIDFDALDIRGKNSSLQQAKPTRISIERGVAKLEQCEIGGAGATLRAAGTLGLTGDLPIQLEAVGQTDLALLSVVAAPLEAGGTMKIDLRANGPLLSPQTKGYVELQNANLFLPNPRLQIGNMRMRADLDGEHVTVQQLTGNLNGGAFTGGGDLKFGTGGLRDVNLFLKGKDTFMEYPGSVKTTSTVDLQFVSQGKQLMLTGNVEVQDGFYESPLDVFKKSNSALDTGVAARADIAGNPVVLDIKIDTKRPVEMDNNLGRLSARVDVRLTGTAENVGLLGKLDLEQDGKLYFGDRTYYIERGTVRFLDAAKVRPELDIQAYTRTSDYTIKLGLKGELNEVTTTFTSDPPLSRDDVIAVLLTGRTVADNRGVDLRALEATSLAAGALNASLSSQLHRAVGVSRISIQPAAVAAESNPGARITVTQDFTDSMRLMYSMNLSDSNDQIWVGEYDISRRFTTRMVKQSDNTYRGEFRHDVRFGSSAPASAVAASERPVSRRVSQVKFTGGSPFPEDVLAKIFKVKAGQQYKAMKVRKGSERVSKFLMKNGYLESRVRLDREDSGQQVGLTVRIETGPVVQFVYQGATLPKGQRSRLRDIWHAGISDQQRPEASRELILSHFAQKGFLQAQADVRTSTEGDRKSVRFEIKPGVQYKHVHFVTEGASHPHNEEILRLLNSGPMKVAVYRSPDKVVEAVTNYYRERGYLDAQVSAPAQRLDAAGRTGHVLIAVDQGPVFRVGDVAFQGNEVLSASELRAGFPLEPGAVFEPARIEPCVAALKTQYGNLGYRDAHIEYAITRHDDRAAVNVSFTIAENRQTAIGAVTIQGNRHTSTQFARARLRVSEGDVASTGLIRQSVKNLAQTGAYTTTDIQLAPPAASSSDTNPVQISDLLVSVHEPKPYRLLYGGLYDTGHGPGFIADLQNHNMLGAGRVLGFRTRYDSETNEARIYITQPTWRTRRLSTTFSIYYTREEEYLQTTPTDKLGISIQQDLQLRSKWLLSYGYRYEKQKGFVPDPAAPDIPAEVVRVSPLMLTFSRDARDSFLDATKGSFISHGFEFAPRLLGSDYPYVRYYLQFFKYFPLTKPHPVPFGEKEQPSRWVFATGSRLGIQKGFDSTGAVLTDRFYAGGGTTVRGFRQDELGPKLATGQPAGGNAVLILNEELRYPVWRFLDAVTFIDIGNVYPRFSDFKLSELRSAGGFGLRIRNPFIVLRFDYGFKFNRRPGETIGAFFFSIGQAF